MRKSGAKTEKICWNLKVINNENTLFEKDYPSLKVIGDDLGFKYNRVVELATGRKKQQSGKYDSVYVFTKLNKKECVAQHNETLQEEKDIVE